MRWDQLVVLNSVLTSTPGHVAASMRWDQLSRDQCPRVSCTSNVELFSTNFVATNHGTRWYLTLTGRQPESVAAAAMTTRNCVNLRSDILSQIQRIRYLLRGKKGWCCVDCGGRAVDLCWILRWHIRGQNVGNLRVEGVVRWWWLTRGVSIDIGGNSLMGRTSGCGLNRSFGAIRLDVPANIRHFNSQEFIIKHAHTEKTYFSMPNLLMFFLIEIFLGDFYKWLTAERFTNVRCVHGLFAQFQH
uniref:Uncharacterized protein n=1 Tax=Lutzomyia longipalpis TaxID=7200 RepID=A0A7G3B1L4_LUTLO